MTRLERKLERNLLAYAAAASAAGVGMLALAQPSQAEIVFTSKQFFVNENPSLDINNDGITDFKFTGHHSMHRTATSHQRMSYGLLSVHGVESGNQPVGGSYASALKAGYVIGPSAKFSGAQRMLRSKDKDGNSYYLFEYGPWHIGPYRIANRYLGVKFLINGETHFGWVRMNVRIMWGAFIRAQVTGYAYETEAGKPIVAAQKQSASRVGDLSNPLPLGPDSSAATLGALAIGASGLEVWRREEQATAG
jgi:hypothetical protein